MVGNISRVRDALDLRISRALCPLDDQPSDRYLKAIRNVRVGNFCAVRLLHLLDKSDSGTADEPLKGFAALGREKAELQLGEALDALKDTVLIAKPEAATAALPFFKALRQKVTKSVQLGAPWEAVGAYYRSVIKKVSAPSRRFYLNESSGGAGAHFDRSWVEAYSQAKEELQQELTMAMAAKAAADAKGGKKPRERNDPDPNSQRSQKKAKKEAAKKEAAKKATAGGTRHRAAGVTAGKTVPVPKLEEVKKWADQLGVTHAANKPHPCWHFHHPQGCSKDAATCPFSHAE